MIQYKRKMTIEQYEGNNSSLIRLYVSPGTAFIRLITPVHCSAIIEKTVSKQTKYYVKCKESGISK